MLEIQAIRRLLKNCLLWIFNINFFSSLIHSWAERSITILIYHEIDPKLFDEHLEYLKKHFNIIPLKDVRDTFLSEESNDLPPYSLVVTFDDGWISNYDLLPILRKHDCSITIFLTVGLVNTNRRIWNYLIDQHDRLNDRLKAIANKEKDKFLLENFGHHPEREYEERSILNLDEINGMSLYADFQSHGMYHSVLPMCTIDVLKNELTESKKRLSQMLQSEVFAIAYPYNRAGRREVEAARAAGYQIGRVGDRRINSMNSDPMTLKAIGIEDGSSIEDLANSIAWARIKKLLHLY